MKTIITLLVLFIAPLVHAQNLRQWMPNVGDVFIFDIQYSASSQGNMENGSANDTCKIVGVDVSVDSSHSHAVQMISSHSNFGTTYYYFNKGDSSGLYPFEITSLQRCKFEGDDFILDFSKSNVDSTIWYSGTLPTIRASQSHGVASNRTYTADFTPTMKWFLSESYYYQDVNGSTASWFRSLKVVLRSSSIVNIAGASDGWRVSASHNYLYVGNCTERTNMIQMLDPLGRPVRSWQLAASDGPREITLNVADVPSGVYFLRLQGGGVDEVRKVAIVH